MNLRSCKAKEKENCLFHKWCDKSEVVSPSLMRGGHSGGTVSMCFGLVEYPDGTMHEHYPWDIQFTDKAVSAAVTAQPDVPRWRAEMGGEYFIANAWGEVDSYTEEFDVVDSNLYNAGNYFQSELEANAVAAKVRDLYKGNL